ncbi:related to Cytochrome P450 [Sporisorium reilianum f. sp. reilianum]|uniref:Related to Cytochrome P450 n=1 Tax=Sporisorium reilianum f. sp. reilianum TaxID=72559 RepID=A0A2N8UDI0_9BASI|nr:related to Cytochrome P450 [Sporisorium reilianum f. sp. reilianum]
MADARLSLTVALALLALWLLRTLHTRSSSARHLPPGPAPQRFFRGNVIPTTHPWRTFAEWTQRYGDIFTLRIGGTYVFVLGQASSAHAILERQSGVSSDRPWQIMAGELISDNRRMLTLGYGARWRLYRKVMHEVLQDKAAREYERVQRTEGLVAMLHLGRDGKRFQEVFKRYAASVIMQVTYDYRVERLDDPVIHQVEECLTSLAYWIRPGTSMLDRYPALMWLPTPLNPWKRTGLQLRQREQTLFLAQWHRVRERVKRSQCQPCFVSKVQERQHELALTDAEGASMAGSLFGAGSDTTASGLAIFVMAVCAFPHVLAKLQHEIDRVCADHLPAFDDLSVEQTPFLHATVQETLRWRPISAGGFAHRLTHDVEYRGYVLPQGSTVVAPHWSISLDPNEYADPHVFRPERFLSSDGGGEAHVHGTWFAPQRGSVAFGFGRRVCPGLHVAMRSLTINLACMAWCFDIRHPSGKPDMVDTLAFTSTANSHPLPFDDEFVYRSSAREQAVIEENRDTGELDRIAAAA